MNARNKQILQLAVPSIISNITVPLLGLVDVAIVGHIGDASYIGAIAVGSMLFNKNGYERHDLTGLGQTRLCRGDEALGTFPLRGSGDRLTVLHLPETRDRLWLVGDVARGECA